MSIIPIVVSYKPLFQWLPKDQYQVLYFSIYPNDLLHFIIQKHTSRGVLKKQFSENTQQSYRRIPMLKSDFSGCFTLNLLHIFKTSFLKNTSGKLLLIITDVVYNVSGDSSFFENIGTINILQRQSLDIDSLVSYQQNNGKST